MRHFYRAGKSPPEQKILQGSSSPPLGGAFDIPEPERRPGRWSWTFQPSISSGHTCLLWQLKPPLLLFSYLTGREECGAVAGHVIFALGVNSCPRVYETKSAGIGRAHGS